MCYGIPFIICWHIFCITAVHSKAKCICTLKYCILTACVEVFYTGSVFILYSLENFCFILVIFLAARWKECTISWRCQNGVLLWNCDFVHVSHFFIRWYLEKCLILEFLCIFKQLLPACYVIKGGCKISLRAPNITFLLLPRCVLFEGDEVRFPISDFSDRLYP
jgi:hypothetical protein